MDRVNKKDTKFKLTPQRLAVIRYLEGNSEHPSADDIYKAVLQKFPTMSFATVYNTLDALKKQGNVLELTVDPLRKRFDPHPEPHHHLICIRCKKIIDIHLDYNLHIPNEKKMGFELVGNHIEFYGVCPECKRNL